MTLYRNPDYLISLVRELLKQPKETEWLEFKRNHIDHDEIGKYISALSNSAALFGKANAYLLWGVDDLTHKIVGTAFSPFTEKVGNQELESWLLHLLTPKILFRFYEIEIEQHRVVLLEIDRALRHPVRFKHEEYIRVGSYTHKLKDYQEMERELWRIFDRIPFEEHTAAENASSDEVLRLLDYHAYFKLLNQPIPEAHERILATLEQDKMIVKDKAGGWNILNLGAVLFAKKLGGFKGLQRKAVRVVVYQGDNRVETINEQEGTRGYASGFEGLIGFINNLLPANEVIRQALRKKVLLYPELAVRELVANAIIHQDFFITGAGPMVEIFDNRMEITNPGKPLVEAIRFLDSPPRSRNEALASFMRRIGVCEERGSGIDKVVFQTELYQLPAPSFEVPDENTKAVLFAPIPLGKMDRDSRIRACYLHTCLKYVSRDYMTNTSLRKRFGIDQHNKAQASRFIKETVKAGLVKPHDPDSAPKYMRYIPFWAV